MKCWFLVGKKKQLKLIKLQRKQSFYFFLFDLIKIKIQFWNNFKNLQRHHKIIKKRAGKLLFSISRGLFMKLRRCVVEPYSIPNEDIARKCRNFAHFIFFHFVSKKTSYPNLNFFLTCSTTSSLSREFWRDRQNPLHAGGIFFWCLGQFLKKIFLFLGVQRDQSVTYLPFPMRVSLTVLRSRENILIR